MRKKLSFFMCICLTMCLIIGLSIPSAAEGAAIYVSSSGNDSSGDGTEANPFQTLQMAVGAAGNGDTVYVMTDLTASGLTRITDKSITITSVNAGNPCTITRSSGFSTASDTARGQYNPAMLEVTVNSTSGTASLRLENIIFDDNGLTEGASYGQAATGGSTNTDYVQDAIVAAYGYTENSDVDVILGDGAVLRNHGGFSSVRLTETATLTMESGSVIEDTLSGLSTSRGRGVWLQSAKLVMQSGATIQNLNVCGITAGSSSVTMEEGSVIQDLDADAIHASSSSIVVNGMITGLNTSGQAINLNYSTCTIGANGGVCNNNCGSASAIYAMNGSNITIYGKLNDNSSTGRGGALYLVDNGQPSIGTMEDGAEICRNSSLSTGGGIMLNNNCTFTMNGGTISGNMTTAGDGGGIEVRKAATFIMNGGIITNNTANGFHFMSYNYSGYGGGINLEASWQTAHAELNGGTISGNTSTDGGQDIAITSDGYGYSSGGYIKMLSSSFTLGDPNIYMATDSKTVAASGDNAWFSLGNASSNAVTALTSAATSNGWTLLSTLWENTPENTSHFTISKPASAAADIPIYAIIIETDANGAPVSGATPLFAVTTEVSGRLDVQIPTDGANGFAVALAQPSDDYGSVIITGPASITYTGDASYMVPYTATYTMSEGFANTVASFEGQISSNPSSMTFSFTVNLDAALTPEMSGSSYVYLHICRSMISINIKY